MMYNALCKNKNAERNGSNYWYYLILLILLIVMRFKILHLTGGPTAPPQVSAAPEDFDIFESLSCYTPGKPNTIQVQLYPINS